MTGRTHRRINTVAGVAAVYASARMGPTGDQFAWAVVGAVAMRYSAKLPDLDIRVPLMPHRGPLSHGPFYVLPLLAAMTYNAAPYGPAALALTLGVSAGVVLHLAADAMTVSGLPGRPVCDRIYLLPYRLRVRTGRGIRLRRAKERNRGSLPTAPQAPPVRPRPAGGGVRSGGKRSPSRPLDDARRAAARRGRKRTFPHR